MSQFDYIELIHKELSQEISSDELRALNAWIQQDEENKFTAETIRAVWNLSDISDEDLEGLAGNIDVNQEFKFLQDRIQSLDEHDETPVVPLKRKAWRIAAGFAMVVGLASTWFFYDGFSSNQLVEFKTGNQPENIVLADGSVIHLNANSTLTYPTSFSDDTREVRLRGEGFFEIAKDANHPFVVRTQYEDITVLGTSFNVRALENETYTEVAVISGKVRVESESNQSELEMNEKVRVNRDNGNLLKEDQNSSPNESSWLTKKLSFSNTLLSDVLEDLEVYYNVNFKVDNPSLVNCPFTANFEDEKLITVLNTISTVLDVSIQEESKDNYVLVGGGCQ